jgi:hypothetical protein
MNPFRGVAILPAALCLVVYAFLFRPRMSRWGATDEEVRRTLPGDELENTNAAPIASSGD